jgi:hypothetical protein
MESQMMVTPLRRHRGHRNRAAKDPGSDHSALHRKIRNLTIKAPPTKGRSRKTEPAPHKDYCKSP